MKNQFHQDIYGEMTFLRTLEKYGFDISIRQAGIDFANIQNALCHANKAGRDNLRGGIAQLIKIPGGENIVAYLKTNIWSEASLVAVVYLGSDDGIKVWLNGQQVHQNNLQ